MPFAWLVRSGALAAALAPISGPFVATVYQRLASAAIDWTRVHVFFTDERCVPPRDTRSNCHMARAALLGCKSAPHARRRSSGSGDWSAEPLALDEDRDHDRRRGHRERRADRRCGRLVFGLGLGQVVLTTLALGAVAWTLGLPPAVARKSSAPL